MEHFQFKMNLFNLICMTLLAVIFVFTIAAILYKFRVVSFCVCPRFSDDVSVCRLLLFFMQICNFWSDIYLLHSLYWISDMYTFTIVNVVLTSSLVFLILSSVLINIIFMDKWLFPWILSNTNPRSSHWIRDREHYRWFIALLIISGSVYHSLLMVNSKMFGVTRTNMALSTWNLIKILNNKYVVRLFYSYSMTVLVIQGSACLLAEGVYYTNMVATALTVLSMVIFTLHDHCCFRKTRFDIDRALEKREISYFHLVVEMTDYHNDDEYKVNQSKEMRTRWTQCIRREIEKESDGRNDGMDNVSLEIVAVEEMRNPNLQMFMVYGVVSDDSKYWMQRLDQCTTLDQAIGSEFELEQTPKLNVVKYSNDPQV